MNITYARSDITFDGSTLTRLRQLATRAALPAGGEVFVAARRIRLPMNQVVRLEDAQGNTPWNLVLLCETLEAGGATLDASGRAGANSTRVGTDGERGLPAGAIKVWTRQIEGALKVVADGGAGGDGIAGVDGVAPIPPTPADESPTGKPRPGKPGRPPTAGSSGGAGGNGGFVTVTYVSASIQPTVSAGGGQGGLGKPGGKTVSIEDGTVIEQAASGADGPAGANGLTGLTLNVGGPWSLSSLLLAPGVESDIRRVWRAHAEWRFRRLGGTPTAADQKDTRSFYVLAQAAGDSAAADRLSAFDQLQVAIGLGRFTDSGADVDRFAQRYGLVQPAASDALDAARSVLIAGSVGIGQLQLLQLRNNDLAARAADLQDELLVATIKRNVRRDVASNATVRYEAARAAVEQRAEQLRNKQVDVGAVVAVGVIGIFAFIASVVSAGTAAAPIVAAVIAAAPGIIGLIEPSLKDEAEFVAGAAALGGKKAVTDAALDWSKLSAGLLSAKDALEAGERIRAALIEAGGAMNVNLLKMIGDLRKSTGDEESKKLLVEVAEQAYSLLVATAERKIADAELTAAVNHLARATELRNGMATLIAQAQSSNARLQDAVFILLQSARIIGDIASRYQFLAARALEIYALQDRSGDMKFDAGFVNPDIEEDFRQDFITSADFLAALAAASFTSAGIAPLVQAFDDYETGILQQQVFPVSISASAAELEQLKATGHLTMALALSDLSGEVFDVKAIGVQTYLKDIGYDGSSLMPFLPILVSHLGRSEQRQLDQNIVPQTLPIRSVLVTANRIPPPLSNGSQIWVAQSAPVGARFGAAGFVGRGAAGSYEISVDLPAVANEGFVWNTLSAVTFVVLCVGFLKTSRLRSMPSVKGIGSMEFALRRQAHQVMTQLADEAAVL